MENETDVQNLPGAADGGVPRPLTLEEFNGQSAAKDNLSVYVASSKIRGAAMDHVLFDGPPGVGKTTLAQVLANELGVSFKTVYAPTLKQVSDIVTMLSTLEERDVLFIDEIHRLPIMLEEVLYTAMEDFCLDLVVGDVGSSRIVKVPLPPFTLIGATTRRGMLSEPLLERFGISVRLELYTDGEMETVLFRACNKLGLGIEPSALEEIARRSRGTPRTGLRLLSRVRDHAVASGRDTVTFADADDAMRRVGIDAEGLTENDRRYVRILTERFRCGPVGLKSLAMALGEKEETLENTVEPFLVRKGIVDRTPRGRVLRKTGIECFTQAKLF